MTAELNIEKLTPRIGAIIHDIDVRELDAESFAPVYQAFLDHQVIFFRDQTLTRPEHVAFARRFGNPEVHPFIHRDDIPEIHPLRTDAAHPPKADTWHADVTFIAEPPKASILYAHELPEVGGDTMWANMYAAYDMLSPGMKVLLEPMRATHDFLSIFGQEIIQRDDAPEKIREAKEKLPPISHPVVRTHPETGRKCLFVNSTFTSHIDGIPSHESEALLAMLYKLVAETPEFTCRFRWEPRSLAIWDNRCTQHYAIADYVPHSRYMERVSVEGEKPC